MKIDKDVTHKKALESFETLEKRFNVVHSNKYGYTDSVYLNNTTKINIICPLHGTFFQTPKDHLSGRGCKECRKDKLSAKYRITKEKFIEKAKELHPTYNYSLVDFTNVRNSKDKVKVICPVHGEFYTRIADHLNKKAGCSKCNNDVKTSNLWQYSKWELAGMRSKHFDSFKLYVLECWSDSERFIKIGKTFTSIGKRYISKKSMPYEYKVLQVEEGSSSYISSLETEIKANLTSKAYTPVNTFNGASECFTLDAYKDIKRKGK